MFASVVHAKVPESLAASVPEATRFVPAAYLHIRPNTLVHVVSSKTGNGVHIFQAEVKPLSQIVWDTSLAPDVIRVASDVDAAARPREPARPAQPHDSELGIREGLPLNGPPRAWVREHGPTPDCSACNSQSRHGRKHTAPCCRRFQEWVENERKKLSEPIPQPEVPKPIEPSDPSQSPQHHPTARIRYHQKMPPAIPGDSAPPTESERPEPEASGDHPGIGPMDIDPEYEPSFPDDDMHEESSHVGPPDPMKLPMDVSTFMSWLMPPPEELVHGHSSRVSGQGVYCPIFVPPKSAEKLRSEPFHFCGVDIFLIEPDKLKVGTPLVEHAAKTLSHELGVRIIGSRWVLTAKTVDGKSNQCRARCVVQEVASGSQSAHNLGISSSTPSIEAFRSFIAAVQYFDLWLTSLDISTAFLHSNLPRGVRAIIRLPADLSFAEDSYQSYIHGNQLSIHLNQLSMNG